MFGRTYFSWVVFGARHFKKAFVQGEVVSYRILWGQRERERECKVKQGRKRQRKQDYVIGCITLAVGFYRQQVLIRFMLKFRDGPEGFGSGLKSFTVVSPPPKENPAHAAALRPCGFCTGIITQPIFPHPAAGP